MKPLVSLVALAALAGCAAHRSHGVSSETALAVIASEQELARHEAALSSPAAGEDLVDCRTPRTLRDNICALASRICALVDRDRTVADGRARCEKARLRCHNARKRVSALCGDG